jgi:hypothetical protein
LGDKNSALPDDATAEGHEERMRIISSARHEAVLATYNRALKSKLARDEVVQLRTLEEGEWVLVGHKSPQKFEIK